MYFEWLCFWPTLIGKLGRASAVTEWQKVWGLIYVLRFWARIQNQSTVLQLWIGHFQAKKVANNLVIKKEWFACFLSAASTDVKAGCMWTDRLVLGWDWNWGPLKCDVVLVVPFAMTSYHSPWESFFWARKKSKTRKEKTVELQKEIAVSM